MSKSKVPKAPQEIITDVSAEPVVCAWRTLDRGGHGQRIPPRVEVLRRRPKSVVYRLPGVGHAGADVIAKQCVRDSALAEQRTYRLLHDIHISHPDYYGYVEGNRDGFAWLFLGDAAGERYDPTDPVQRRLASRWLGLLHTLTSKLSAATQLPDRGPAHYLKHLHAAQSALDGIRKDLKLSAEEGEVLDDVRVWLDRTEHRWADVEAVYKVVPGALVHGDFAERNIHVRQNGTAGAVLLVFDWEVAGWGMPGVDLEAVDFDVYWEHVRRFWPHLDRRTLRRAATLGRLIRGGVAAVHWETQKILGKYPCHTLDDMRSFRQRIVDCFQSLGWSTPERKSLAVVPPQTGVPIAGIHRLLANADPSGVPELRALMSKLLEPSCNAKFRDERTIWRGRVHRARFRVDDTERSFVLKRLPLDRAHREQLAVRDWLPRLGLDAHGPPLLGVAASPGAQCVWHVYEDLGTDTLDRCAAAPTAVAAAVRLLAEIHTRASQCAFLGECREFGVGLGEHFLASGVADGLRILEGILRHGTELTAVQGDLFERLRQRLLELRAEVPKRARLLRKYGGPETLLHGDVWTCNIFVLPDLHIRLIDWDHAGVGHASYDLSALLLRFPSGDRDAILDTYAAAVTGAGWQLPPREILNGLFETAELARLVSATLWPALTFYRERAAWASERLAEVDTWFAQMQPVLEDCA